MGQRRVCSWLLLEKELEPARPRSKPAYARTSRVAIWDNVTCFTWTLQIILPLYFGFPFFDWSVTHVNLYPSADCSIYVVRSVITCLCLQSIVCMCVCVVSFISMLTLLI